MINKYNLKSIGTNHKKFISNLTSEIQSYELFCIKSINCTKNYTTCNLNFIWGKGTRVPLTAPLHGTGYEKWKSSQGYQNITELKPQTFNYFKITWLR
jgi:hypothetical protein